ncbi:unnamed protein product [Leuciscus chuanchicus]
MHHKAIERRKKGLQMRKEAEREDESRAEQVDQTKSSGTLSEAGSPVSAADVSWAQNGLATHRHRVEALRKTIGALETHMDDEAAWLRIKDHKGALIQSRSAGQGISGAESRETLPDCVSLDGDKETNHRQKRVSIRDPKEIKNEKDEWSELSELYCQRLHGHLSLAKCQQFLREEESSGLERMWFWKKT